MSEGRRPVDTHSVMGPDEYAEAAARTTERFRIRLWCDAWVAGERVRLSVECTRAMEDRARRWLERQQAANRAGEIHREQVVTIGGDGWNERS